MKFVPSAVSRQVARQVLVARGNSPTLLLAAGVVGVVGATVLACRGTLHVEKVLNDAISDLDKINTIESDEYSEKEKQQDRVHVYVRTTVSLCKLYGPAVVLGTASIAALVGSHNILSKRNAALTAAYASLEKGFREYRKRVIDEYGEDKDREYRYGLEPCEIDDPISGKKVVGRRPTQGPSQYARFFDTNNKNWTHLPEYRLLFLRAQQTYLNDQLRARGHVFLNDVYDALGFDRTPAGSVTGWLWNGDGDQYIDFGVFDESNIDRFYDFVATEEGVWLDFNVDGTIWDKI